MNPTLMHCAFGGRRVDTRDLSQLEVSLDTSGGLQATAMGEGLLIAVRAPSLDDLGQRDSWRP